MALSSHGTLARHHGLTTAHRRRVILVASLALLTSTAGLPRMGNLGTCCRTNVDPLAEGSVHLEARRALLVGHPRRRRLYPVARVGTHIHGLPDDVVGSLAVITNPKGMVKGETRLWTKKGVCLG